MAQAWENYLMGREARQDVSLTEAEQRILQQWAHIGRDSRTGLRAAIVLMASAGLARSEIASQLHVTRPTVAMWIRRFRQEGPVGLRDRARPGRRRSLRDSEVVLRTLTTRPSDASFRIWSSRSLAAELGVSNGTVARVWRRWGLRPALLPRFQLPTSPTLSVAVTDLVGLYCDAGNGILVLPADERAPAGPLIGRRSQDPADVVRLHEAVLRASAAGSPTSHPTTHRNLVGFLHEEFARYPNARLRLLVAENAGLDHPAIRHWVNTDRVVLHRATAEPTWAEMVVVLVGLVLRQRTGTGLAEYGGVLLDALLQVRRAAHDNRRPFWWGRLPDRSSAPAMLPTPRALPNRTGHCEMPGLLAAATTRP